jgi:hypothetical protein
VAGVARSTEDLKGVGLENSRVICCDTQGPRAPSHRFRHSQVGIISTINNSDNNSDSENTLFYYPDASALCSVAV